MNTTTCKVVMLLNFRDKEIKSGILTDTGIVSSIREYAGTLNGRMLDGIWFDGFEGAISEFKLKRHELYFTVDEPIKKGDWYHVPSFYQVQQAGEDVPEKERINSRLAKVVATTDDLRINSGIFSIRKTLTKIPKSFVEDYVKAKGEIEEVDVNDEVTVIIIKE